jgi:hypothetical protein
LKASARNSGRRISSEPMMAVMARIRVEFTVTLVVLLNRNLWTNEVIR